MSFDCTRATTTDHYFYLYIHLSFPRRNHKKHMLEVYGSCYKTIRIDNNIYLDPLRLTKELYTKILY